jgi:uncharacterized membrane protein
VQPLNYFTTEDEKKIISAISTAENNTSGEIRVHIEKKCSGDPVKCAEKAFVKLGMHKTDLHNGILFYLAIDSHRFALVGDKGIHEKVGQDFWESVRDKVISKFKEGKIADGLSDGILECGMQLKKYFPHAGAADKNELSDDISYN